MAVGMQAEDFAGGATPPPAPGPYPMGGNVSYAPSGAPSWPPQWHTPAPSAGWPSVSWPPTADQLDYWQKAITVGLLVLALPALLAALVRRPERLAAGLARRHVA